MAKAHAEQLVATLIARQQITLKGFNPRVGTKRVGLAAGHQIRIVGLIVRGILTLQNVEHCKLRSDRLLGKQTLEHLSVALVLIHKLRAQNVGFQNANA